MITEINTGIPSQTNKKIINELYLCESWLFGNDGVLPNKNLYKRDAGFLLNTFNKNNQSRPNEILNTYAHVILDMVQNKIDLRFKDIVRIYWNWYHTESLMEFHQDGYHDNLYSIIYNLHNNDGGTEFKLNDETLFYKSIESKAMVFPSKIFHRGIAPKKDLNRFSLNILLEI